MIDVAIIGCGPAGMSAALTAKARNKSVVIFGNGILGNYLYKAEQIDNYLGCPKMSGENMLQTFLDHVKSSEIEVKEGMVSEIFPMGEGFTLNFSNEFISAKTVIITTGMPKVKSIPGEDRLIGKGISYCATCDGMLYKNKDVAIYIESEKEIEDVRFLSEICHKVYLFTKTERLIGLKVLELANVEIMGREKIREIQGDEAVSGVIGNTREIPVQAVFLMRESIAMDKLIKGLKITSKHIKVNKKFETNIKGVYAAGDCVGKPYQVAKATGEAQVAVLNAIAYLDK